MIIRVSVMVRVCALRAIWGNMTNEETLTLKTHVRLMIVFRLMIRSNRRSYIPQSHLTPTFNIYVCIYIYIYIYV